MSPKRRSRGDGGLTFIEAKGLWRGSVEVAPDPVTGARKRKYVYGKVKSDVTRKVREALAELDAGTTVVSASPTVNAWLDYWLENVTKVRPKTLQSYGSSLTYARRAFGRKKLAKLTVDDVYDWHRKMLNGTVTTDGKPLSSTTAHTAHLVLSRALSDAVTQRRIAQNVCRMVSPPRRATPPVKTLTVEEVAAVVRSVEHDRLGGRYAAALLTAMRQGELLGLRWQDVDFEAGTLDVAWQLQRIPLHHGCAELADGAPSCGWKRGADCPSARIVAQPDWEHEHLEGGLYLARPKTATGWRVIPLVGRLRAILWERLAASQREPNPHGLVWTAGPKRSRATGQLLPLDGSPIDPSDDSSGWHDVLERAGVPRVRLHDARHTAITLLYDRKVPEAIIQQIAGQSTVATTRGYRGKFAYQLVEAMEALDSAAGPVTLGAGQTVLSITPRSPAEG